MIIMQTVFSCEMTSAVNVALNTHSNSNPCLLEPGLSSRGGLQGRSLAQIRGGGGGGAVPPEQVPGGNSSVHFGDN